MSTLRIHLEYWIFSSFKNGSPVDLSKIVPIEKGKNPNFLLQWRLIAFSWQYFNFSEFWRLRNIPGSVGLGLAPHRRKLDSILNFFFEKVQRKLEPWFKKFFYFIEKVKFWTASDWGYSYTQQIVICEKQIACLLIQTNIDKWG